MKPVQRLNRVTIAVLESYHSDADTAIMMMENTIDSLKNQLETCQSVTKVLQDKGNTVTKPLQPAELGKETVTESLHDALYWKKLSETVDSCIERAKRY